MLSSGHIGPPELGEVHRSLSDPASESHCSFPAPSIEMKAVNVDLAAEVLLSGTGV